MKDYKAAYLKAKELIALLDDMNYSTMIIKDEWVKRKDLCNELAALEAEIKQEEQAREAYLKLFMEYLEEEIIDIVYCNEEQGKEYLIKQFIKFNNHEKRTDKKNCR